MTRSVSKGSSDLVYFKDSLLGRLPVELLQLILDFIPRGEQFKAMVNFSCVAQDCYKTKGSLFRGIKQTTAFANEIHQVKEITSEAELLPLNLTAPEDLKVFRPKFLGLFEGGYAIYSDIRSGHLIIVNPLDKELVLFGEGMEFVSRIRSVIPIDDTRFVLIEEKGLVICHVEEKSSQYYRLVAAGDEDHVILNGSFVKNSIFLTLAKRKGMGGGDLLSEITYQVRFDLAKKAYNHKTFPSEWFFRTQHPFKRVAKQVSRSYRFPLNFIDGSDLFFLSGYDFEYNIGKDFNESITPKCLLHRVEKDKQISKFQKLAHAFKQISNTMITADQHSRRGGSGLSAHMYEEYTKKLEAFSTFNVGKRVYQLQADGSKTLFATVPCSHLESHAKNFFFMKNEAWLVCLHKQSKFNPNSTPPMLYIFDSYGNKKGEKQFCGPDFRKSSSAMLLKNDFLVVGHYSTASSRMGLYVMHVPTQKVVLNDASFWEDKEVHLGVLDAIDIAQKGDKRLELLFFFHRIGSLPVVKKVAFTDFDQSKRDVFDEQEEQEEGW